MSNLNNIIQVTVLKQTKTTRQASFNVLLIVGPNPTFGNRIKYYNTNDLAGIAADLTNGVADPEYIAAAAVASQAPKIALIGIGREDVGDANMTETLDAIYAESQDFYAFAITERDVTKQQAAAAWGLTQKKWFVTSSVDPNIIDQAEGADTTSLAYIFNNLANDHVSLFYKGDAATKYTEAAFAGQVLAYSIGTWSGMGKTLPGEAPDNLSDTQSKNAHDKFCNTYEEVGEVNVVLEGFVSNGDFADTTVFADYLVSRIQNAVWSLITTLPKVPGDDSGITAIENVMAQEFKLLQDRGAITKNDYDQQTKEQIGGYFIVMPENVDRPAADKAARVLKEVKATCWYSGAIHKVQIEITVVL